MELPVLSESGKRTKPNGWLAQRISSSANRLRCSAHWAAAELGYATATDLADWLVRQAGVPFREAHHITGAAVKLAESRGVALDALSLDDLKRIDQRIGEDVFGALSVESSVAARSSLGGTAPDQVRKQVAAARKVLGMDS